MADNLASTGHHMGAPDSRRSQNDALHSDPGLTTWTTEDRNEALARAGAFLAADPVRHNRLLTLLTTNCPQATIVCSEDVCSTVGLARFDHSPDRVALPTPLPLESLRFAAGDEPCTSQ